VTARARTAVEIREETADALPDHGAIEIAFDVERILHVGKTRTGAPVLRERAVPEPWRKDYDAIPGNRPADWPTRFDVSRWVLLSAWIEGRRVGGLVIAEGAMIWDLRVHPELRGRGIGSELFAAAERWIRAHGGRRLEVETQNVNLPACRFYERCGCRLARVEHGTYPDFPDEVELVWHKRLR
jgi:GNAT superfamily N-acetyltransferase